MRIYDLGIVGAGVMRPHATVRGVMRLVARTVFKPAASCYPGAGFWAFGCTCVVCFWLFWSR